LGGLFITRPQQASTSEPAKSQGATAASPVEPAASPKNQPVASVSTPSNTSSNTSAPAPVQAVEHKEPVQQAASNRSPSNAAPVVSAPAQDSITASEARGVIENWFVAKRSMFGSSYSASAAQAITTGILLNDITKPNGSIDWLRSNNAEYRFGAQRVDSIDRVVSNGDNATVAVTATEDRTLYKDGKVDPTQTDFKTKTTVYTLQRIGGAWKIADYKND
jgi:ARC6-like, IMS domain